MEIDCKVKIDKITNLSKKTVAFPSISILFPSPKGLICSGAFRFETRTGIEQCAGWACGNIWVDVGSASNCLVAGQSSSEADTSSILKGSSLFKESFRNWQSHCDWWQNERLRGPSTWFKPCWCLTCLAAFAISFWQSQDFGDWLPLSFWMLHWISA